VNIQEVSMQVQTGIPTLPHDIEEPSPERMQTNIPNFSVNKKSKIQKFYQLIKK